MSPNVQQTRRIGEKQRLNSLDCKWIAMEDGSSLCTINADSPSVEHEETIPPMERHSILITLLS